MHHPREIRPISAHFPFAFGLDYGFNQRGVRRERADKEGGEWLHGLIREDCRSR